jgi:hypothetical protein
VAAACKAISVDRWRYDCFFQGAEALHGQRWTDATTRVAPAQQLCFGAGPYASKCLNHLLAYVGAGAPAADGDPTLWGNLNAYAEATRHHLAGKPEIARRIVDRMWAFALKVAYGAATNLDGTSMDGIEAAGVPHARAALTWTLLSRSEGDTADLVTWIDRVQTAMTVREARPGAGRVGRIEVRNSVRRYWHRVLGSESKLEWTPFMGNARRAVSDSPFVDTAICVLESAARTDPIREDLLLQGANHPEEIIRWTAVRLLAGTRRGASQIEIARTDASAMVRERADTEPIHRGQAKRSPETPPGPEERAGGQERRPPAPGDKKRPEGKKKPAPKTRPAPGVRPAPGEGSKPKADAPHKPRPGTTKTAPASSSPTSER